MLSASHTLGLASRGSDGTLSSIASLLRQVARLDDMYGASRTCGLSMRKIFQASRLHMYTDHWKRERDRLQQYCSQASRQLTAITFPPSARSRTARQLMTAPVFLPFLLLLVISSLINPKFLCSTYTLDYRYAKDKDLCTNNEGEIPMHCVSWTSELS